MAISFGNLAQGWRSPHFWIDRFGAITAGPIAKAAVNTTAFRVYSLVVSLCTTIIMARELGVDGFGVYMIGVSAAFAASILARAGLPSQITRTVADACGSGRAAGLPRFALFTAAIASGLSVVVSAAGAVSVSVFMRNAPAEMSSAAVLGCLIAPLMTLVIIAQSHMRGMMRPIAAYGPQLALAPSLLLISVLGLAAAGQLTPRMALFAFATSWAAAATLAWTGVALALRRDVESHATDIAPLMKIGPWLQGAAILIIGGLFEIFLGVVDLLVIGAVTDPATVGVYALAARFAAPVAMPTAAIASGLGPMIAALNASDDISAIQIRLRKSVIASTLTSYVVAAIACLGSMLVAQFMELDWRSMIIPMAILTAALLARATLGNPYEVLVMLGRRRPAAFVTATTYGVGLIALFFAAGAFGVFGAATAVAATIAIRDLLLAIALARLTGLRSDIFAVAKTAA